MVYAVLLSRLCIHVSFFIKSFFRFCFDVLAMDRTEQMTLQALSEEDRRQWLDAMDGREPVRFSIIW